ncbi:hypothetical protein KZC56_17470 [Microbacterium sp. SSW1-47]|uniref:hypothetical protein n=1 Tax=Microbacterium sufflavum TaxID=2851649 RepID=UPI001FFCF636|nr:hypothetical protein [Microbacterium sufflavum]MCK2028090.1 hypothetical protein [Microbacterium sufflavum]
MRRVSAILVTAGTLLVAAGCAPTASPDDAAWSECIAFYDEHEPEGIVDAESGDTFDSERICHNMIGHRGQDEFTAFWNDPDRVAEYARGF